MEGGDDKGLDCSNLGEQPAEDDNGIAPNWLKVQWKKDRRIEKGRAGGQLARGVGVVGVGEVDL